MRNVLLHGALIALCLFIMASARAEQPDQRLLSLQDALRLGLQQHPQLAQFTLRASSRHLPIDDSWCAGCRSAAEKNALGKTQ